MKVFRQFMKSFEKDTEDLMDGKMLRGDCEKENEENEE